MVDAVIRGRFARGPRARECASPRHAGLIVVTGLWNVGLAEAALSVIEQAPAARKVMILGDCALGRGPLAAPLKYFDTVADSLSADAEVGGCPISLEAIREGLMDVAR